MRNAPGEPDVIKLAWSMLECARQDLSLVERGNIADTGPSRVRGAIDPELLALAALLRQTRAAPPPHPPRQPPAMGYPWGRPLHRQRVPIVRYVVPAGCIVAVILALIAAMPTGPHPEIALLSHPAAVSASESAQVAVPAELQRQQSREDEEVAQAAPAHDEQRANTVASPDTAEVAAQSSDKAIVAADPQKVPQQEHARDAAQVTQLTTERDELGAKVAALSAEATRRRLADRDKLTSPHVDTPQVAVPAAPPVAAPRRPDAAASRPASAAVHQPRPPSAAAELAVNRGGSSISGQLMQARAALVSGDRQGARGMMKEAQTLIVFKPGGAAPTHAGAAASQIAQALIMLSNGNDAGALGYLNKALTAILNVS